MTNEKNFAPKFDIDTVNQVLASCVKDKNLADKFRNCERNIVVYFRVISWAYLLNFCLNPSGCCQFWQLTAKKFFGNIARYCTQNFSGFLLKLTTQRICNNFIYSASFPFLRAFLQKRVYRDAHRSLTKFCKLSTTKRLASSQRHMISCDAEMRIHSSIAIKIWI